MVQSYRNKTGKYQKELDLINSNIPGYGMTNNKYMNLYLTVSKLYNDIYNNGGCNIEDCYMSYINDYIIPFQNEIKSINFNVQTRTLLKNLRNFTKLEKLVDEVVEILRDKDLSYAKYSIWINHKAELLSFEAKDGFDELTFGDGFEFQNWVQIRKDMFHYKTV